MTTPTAPTTTPTTTPTSPTPGPGLLLLCGGGTEGDIGDTGSWSVAYGALLEAGDVTGDGQVQDSTSVIRCPGACSMSVKTW